MSLLVATSCSLSRHRPAWLRPIMQARKLAVPAGADRHLHDPAQDDRAQPQWLWLDRPIRSVQGRWRRLFRGLPDRQPRFR